jgi:NodT family efflux transporter outer membrane factor (OMF) lipoprotein
MNSLNKQVIVLLAPLSILLSACTTLGPEYERPESPLKSDWHSLDNESTTSESVNVDEWWEVFNDPVLSELIHEAYSQNLPLKIAGVRILEARARLALTRGQQYPQQQSINLSSTYSSLSESRANTQPLDLNYWDYSAGFNISWEADIWGKVQRAIHSADASYLASYARYDDYLVTLIASVAEEYTLIRSLQKQILLANKNIEFQKKSLSIVTARYNLGAGTELDKKQAETLLYNTQASLPRLNIRLQQRINSLGLLLGTTPHHISEKLSVENIQIPDSPMSIAAGIPADLLRRRPDVRFAEHEAIAQSALIGVAESELYPSFSLFGSLGLVASDNTEFTKSGRDGVGELFERDSIEFIGGLGINWNIFNYGRIKNRVRIQDARFQQSLLQYQYTVLKAAQEVEDSLVAFSQAGAEVGVLSRSVVSSERAAELALVQFQDGTVEYTRVLDTQQSLLEQEKLLTLAQTFETRSAITMYRALGGGWGLRENNDVVPDNIKMIMKTRTDWGPILENDPN